MSTIEHKSMNKSPMKYKSDFDTVYNIIAAHKMVQFYETYSAGSFIELAKQYGMQHFLPGNSGMKLPSNENTIVPIELAQIPTVLFSTG